ncbi:Conserved_hypothetical protein [Hexamita inflata]|uniref:Uncharacterized protein n=1 Tax=Hexamita inflata TaxID=28002 RepID=A0AA86UT29_9EUKA|nr:Conserved hypothetical protein [Hexamita inflata]
MLTRLQIDSFELALLELIQLITGSKIASKLQLFQQILQLEHSERKGLWKTMAEKIQATQLEAHDYFFNTWQLQFYEDVNLYKEGLKRVFEKAAAQTESQKAQIQATIAGFQKLYPHNRCNERKLYQTVYQYAKFQAKNASSDSFKKSESQEPKAAHVEQLSIFDNYAFQRATQLYRTD